MRKIIPYAVVFLLASGTAALLVLVLLLVKPGMAPTPASMPGDSLRMAARDRAVIADAASADQATVPADSARLNQRQTADTTAPPAARATSVDGTSASKADRNASVRPAQNTPSVPVADATKSALLADKRKSAPAADNATSAMTAEGIRKAMESPLNESTGADSVQESERKSMAKVLEAMDPASAAKILNDFPDDDIKQIILTIKRRQAAKILAALDPDRAARIMR